jgi:hypothetical protein
MAQSMGFADKLVEGSLRPKAEAGDRESDAAEQPALPAITRDEVHKMLFDFGIEVGTAHKQTGDRLEDLEKHVLGLHSQQAMQQWMAERNIRVAALDLAIKYMPEQKRASEDPSMLINVAEALLIWLKETVQ